MTLDVHLLRSLLGARLLFAHGLFYRPRDGELMLGRPIEISISFEGSHVLRFECGPDGESILVRPSDFSEPDEVDMGADGSFSIKSIADEPHVARVLGKRLEGVSKVTGPASQVIEGLAFQFEGESEWIVVNLGDDLWSFNDRPREVFSERLFRAVE